MVNTNLKNKIVAGVCVLLITAYVLFISDKVYSSVSSVQVEKIISDKTKPLSVKIEAIESRMSRLERQIDKGFDRIHQQLSRIAVR